jgi:tartrate dehydratase beta subunit/fumarate hydratase class I family protein
VTCRPIAKERFDKHIPATTNTEVTIGQVPLLWNGSVNTAIEEAVFSMDPTRDCRSSSEQNQMILRIEGVQWNSVQFSWKSE